MPQTQSNILWIQQELLRFKTEAIHLDKHPKSKYDSSPGFYAGYIAAINQALQIIEREQTIKPNQP